MSQLAFVLNDEESWLKFAEQALAQDQAMHAETFLSPASLRARLRRTKPDIFILDWKLPGHSGMAVLRMIREEFALDTPVIMLTQLKDADDIVNALNQGADDYITKPVVPAVLLAKTRALLRRTQDGDSRIEFEVHGGVKFDLKSLTARRDGHDVPLTNKEFSLALLLFRSLGLPVSRETISLKIWHLESLVQSRTIDAHIAQIRRKLRLRPGDGFLLSSVYGYGYRLEKVEQAE